MENTEIQKLSKYLPLTPRVSLFTVPCADPTQAKRGEVSLQRLGSAMLLWAGQHGAKWAQVNSVKWREGGKTLHGAVDEGQGGGEEG